MFRLQIAAKAVAPTLVSFQGLQLAGFAKRLLPARFLLVALAVQHQVRVVVLYMSSLSLCLMLVCL